MMHILSVSNPNEEVTLRSSCKIVWDQDFDNGDVSKIVSELHAALAHYGNGVGLSAIQLWYPLQIFVINCRPTKSFPDMQTFSQTIINPVTKNLSSDTFDWREWCMSIADEQCVPQYRYQVRRSVSVHLIILMNTISDTLILLFLVSQPSYFNTNMIISLVISLIK